MIMEKLAPKHYSEIIKAFKGLGEFYYHYKQKEIDVESLAYKELIDWIDKENKGLSKLYVYKLTEDTGIVDCVVFFDMEREEIFMRSSQKLETTPEWQEDAIISVIEKAKEIGIKNIKIYDDVSLLKIISTPSGFFDGIEEQYNITTEQAKDKIIESKVKAYKKNNFVKVGEFEFFDIYAKK